MYQANVSIHKREVSPAFGGMERGKIEDAYAQGERLNVVSELCPDTTLKFNI